MIVGAHRHQAARADAQQLRMTVGAFDPVEIKQHIGDLVIQRMGYFSQSADGKPRRYKNKLAIMQRSATLNRKMRGAVAN